MRGDKTSNPAFSHATFTNDLGNIDFSQNQIPCRLPSMLTARVAIVGAVEEMNIVKKKSYLCNCSKSPPTSSPAACNGRNRWR